MMADHLCYEPNSRCDLSELFPSELLEFAPDEQWISVTLYRLLAQGYPISVPYLADALKCNEDSVHRALRAWPGVYFDEAGQVIGYWGLSLVEMDHRFEVDDRQLYTWCAWDSLWIPAIIGEKAVVTSRCPESGHPISLTVSPQRILKVAPAGVVMSFLRPEASKIQQDVITHFCHFVHFFSSRENGERWVTRMPGTVLMSLEEGYELGHRKNSVQYPNVL